jgi:hypothetical protein
VSVVTDPKAAHASGIPHAECLVGFAEAAVADMAGDVGVDDESAARDLPAWRDRVRGELSPEALVDAAAVVANFQRMVRIADGTGIALDTPVNLLTHEIRADLGIDGFASAGHTRSTGPLGRLAGRALRPLALSVMRFMGTRRQARERSSAGPDGRRR